MAGFRWNDWNLDHATGHGVRIEEAEVVILNAGRPYPIHHPDGRWLVLGPGSGGRLLQVVYLEDADGTVYVIHARPLTENEKRRYRRTIKHET